MFSAEVKDSVPSRAGERPKATETPAAGWKGFYEALARKQKFLPGFDAAEEHRVRMVLRTFGRAVRSVLDVGCGDGYLCSVYKKVLRIPRIAGVDYAGPHVERARAAFPDIPFVEADICELPFRDGAFDVVSAVEILEHLEDPAQAFAELARVAAREVIVTVPNNEEPERRLCPHCLRNFYLDGHIQKFDESRLRALAEVAALRVRRVIVYRPWEERRFIRKLYSPVKKLFFPEDFRSGGWLALAAEKRRGCGNEDAR
jgi:ubiquinone/menaquinone biosynthesis C-methylase UbiE